MAAPPSRSSEILVFSKQSILEVEIKSDKFSAAKPCTFQGSEAVLEE